MYTECYVKEDKATRKRGNNTKQTKTRPERKRVKNAGGRQKAGRTSGEN